MTLPSNAMVIWPNLPYIIYAWNFVVVVVVAVKICIGASVYNEQHQIIITKTHCWSSSVGAIATIILSRKFLSCRDTLSSLARSHWGCGHFHLPGNQRHGNVLLQCRPHLGGGFGTRLSREWNVEWLAPNLFL